MADRWTIQSERDSHAATDTRDFTRVELRDLALAEKYAKETLRQCDFLRRNGATDTIRFGLIANYAWRSWRAAARADRRDAKAKGHYMLLWRVPEGYGR